MIEVWLHGLLLQTIALSLAAVAVRALQATLLRRLGAAAAYLAWLLVPVAMLAVALPHPALAALAIHVDVPAVAPDWLTSAPRSTATSAGLASTLAAAAWAGGASLLAVALVRRQRRFEALLDAAATLPAGAGPAVLGVWRRRIVLPQDFDLAYDAQERRLMLLHEGVHLRRGDNLWNLLAAALFVLHWFNPFAWWAWRRVRADQESSCDSAVLREQSPESVGIYAGALLKVQGVRLTPPLATSWQSTHPLVERVRVLQLHRISPARHRAGLRVAALSIVLAGAGGYTLRAGAGAVPAAVPTDDASVMTTVDITQTAVRATAPDVSDKTSVETNIRVLSRMGEQARILVGNSRSWAAPFEFGLTVSRLDGNRLQIDTRLSAGTPTAVLGSPRLIVHDGEKGSVAIDTGDAAGTFAIALTPKVLDALQAAAAGKLEPSIATPQRAP